jgi:transposase
MKKIKIPDKLFKEIDDFCLFNNIKNVEDEIVTYIIQGFNIKKFGLSPFTSHSSNKIDDKKIDQINNTQPKIEKKKSNNINIVKR